MPRRKNESKPRRKKGTGSVARLPEGGVLAGITLPDELGEKRRFQRRFEDAADAERWLLSGSRVRNFLLHYR